MTDIYEWYYTQDEESWELAVVDSRWDAIIAGLDYYDGEPFMICRASKWDFPYNHLFDIEEMDCRTIENNEEMWGDDQGSIFKKDLTKEQRKDLDLTLIEAFKVWCDKNDVELETPWMFKNMRDIEDIDPDNYCWVWTQYSGRPLLGVWGND